MPGAAMKRAARRPGRTDSGAHWISYSDMMASLLLVFILAVCMSIYQYFSLLETKTRELDEQQAVIDRTQITLAERESELETINVTLMGKQEELAAIQIQLDKQESDLHAAQVALETTEKEQALLQLELDKKDTTLQDQALRLSAMSEVLDSQKQEMLNQQQRIDDLLGIRTEIVTALSQALARANLSASVDEQGDIVLDSSLMFTTGSSAITPSGQSELYRLIPVYLEVLMRAEYRDYVAEIIIEGHTDSTGTYENNLELSQDRALSVAKYCLGMSSLSTPQKAVLQDIMTAKGRSYSNRVFNADGTENMERSRRVEIKFRLKDSEMIVEMNKILSSME